MIKKFGFISLLAIGSIATIAFAQLKTTGLNFAAPSVAGKANVYDPKLGEIIYDSTDSIFYGRYEVVGSPGTYNWEALSNSASSGNPPGTVITFAGASCPSGYLPADGKAYLRTRTDLWNAIGSVNGDGSAGATGDAGCPHATNCFNVPDYRGRFLRGVADGSTNDPDRAGRAAMQTGGASGDAVGSVQTSANASHNHLNGMVRPDSVLFAYGGAAAGASAQMTATAGGSVSTSGYTSSSGASTESRPTNAYVNFCIKI